MPDFDLCVMGCGPAGLAAAGRAWDFGKRVCIVEKGALGGAGIHHGALSSKTLWELSRDYRNALKRDRGFDAGKVEVDFARVVRSVQIACEEKVAQMHRQLSELGAARPGKPGSIEVLPGTARFLDAQRVAVDGPEAAPLTKTDPLLLTRTDPLSVYRGPFGIVIPL